MIVIIRISGQVKIDSGIAETLHRMRLRKKYVAVLAKDTEELHKLLKKVRNFVAYGKINDKTLWNLIDKRGQSISKKKIDADSVVSGLKTQSLEELGLKPFFRLHPPRGGIESKKHYGVGKGVLGDNQDSINKLVERML